MKPAASEGTWREGGGGGGSVRTGGRGGEFGSSLSRESGDARSFEPPVHTAAGIDPVIIARSSLYRLSRTETRRGDGGTSRQATLSGAVSRV